MTTETFLTFCGVCGCTPSHAPEKCKCGCTPAMIAQRILLARERMSARIIERANPRLTVLGYTHAAWCSCGRTLAALAAESDDDAQEQADKLTCKRCEG